MSDGLISVGSQKREELMSTNHFNDKRSFSIETRGGNEQNGTVEKLTSVNDPMTTVKVCQPLQHSQRDLPYDANVDESNLLANPVQQFLIHKLHANANVGIRDERAIKRLMQDELRSHMIYSSHSICFLTDGPAPINAIYSCVRRLCLRE